MTRDLFDLSTTTYVYGIKPPDERWLKMKAIYDACVAADVLIPSDVERFFEGEEPDEAGVLVDLEVSGAAKLWKPGGGSMREGVEVDLTQVPKDVRVIRFVNSY